VTDTVCSRKKSNEVAMKPSRFAFWTSCFFWVVQTAKSTLTNSLPANLRIWLAFSPGISSELISMSPNLSIKDSKSKIILVRP